MKILTSSYQDGAWVRVRGGGGSATPPWCFARGGVANKFCSTREGVYHVSQFVKGGGPVLCIQYGYQIEGFVLLLAKNWLILTYLAYFKSS